MIILPCYIFLQVHRFKSSFVQAKVLPWDLRTSIVWSSINENCFLSAITVLFPFFKGHLFAQAVIGTHSSNSPQSLLSFKELTTLGSSNFTYIVLQSGFDLLSKCLTVPMLSGIWNMYFFYISLLLSWALITTTSESSLPIHFHFPGRPSNC